MDLVRRRLFLGCVFSVERFFLQLNGLAPLALDLRRFSCGRGGNDAGGGALVCCVLTSLTNTFSLEERASFHLAVSSRLVWD